MQPKSILCLGDSYTIGEGVPLYESFPYLLVQTLRKRQINFYAPEIIAKTGFTSFELLQQINETSFLPFYDYVTILIGVNNQYRGLDIEIFEAAFETICAFALTKVQHQPKKIIVLSIPNWGVTPFAANKNEAEVSQDIYTYNTICKKIAEKNHSHFVDITPYTENAKTDANLLTQDNLHYSKISHEQWAKWVAEKIIKEENL